MGLMMMMMRDNRGGHYEHRNRISQTHTQLYVVAKHAILWHLMSFCESNVLVQGGLSFFWCQPVTVNSHLLCMRQRDCFWRENPQIPYNTRILSRSNRSSPNHFADDDIQLSLCKTRWQRMVVKRNSFLPFVLLRTFLSNPDTKRVYSWCLKRVYLFSIRLMSLWWSWTRWWKNIRTHTWTVSDQ